MAKPTFQTNTVTHYNKFRRKKEDKKYLEVGQNVMCIHNKEMATVRSVGHTDFAPGIWIGLELKKPLGERRIISGGKNLHAQRLHYNYTLERGDLFSQNLNKYLTVFMTQR